MPHFTDGPVIVGISNDTIAIPLEKPVLMCIAIYGTPTWSRNGTAMTSSIYEQYDFENRTYHMSFLRFCSFNESDEGNYTCSVSNDYDSTKASVNLRMKSKTCLLNFVCYLLYFRGMFKVVVTVCYSMTRKILMIIPESYYHEALV